MKAVKWLNEHIEEYLMMLCLAGIALVMFVQVIIRKLPWIPALTWAEEFCRFAWIWSVFLSLPYTVKKCNMLRVTALKDIMPEGAAKALDITVDAIIIAAMGMLLYFALPLVGDRYAGAETSPAMQWPMWTIYASMIIGFGLGVFRGIQRLAAHIRPGPEGGRE